MNVIVLTGVSEEGIYAWEEPPQRGIELIHAHEDRLRALLDKPIMVSLHWEDGDEEATATVMLDMPSDAPFVKFKLPFPRT